ncbi:MAG: spermidine synthase [Planctomycetota bacterium]
MWSLCLLFFQLALLGGYIWAHVLAHYVSTRWQGILHGALLIAAICMLPITPDAGWKPGPTDGPEWRILGLLTISVGLPFFALAATGPLLQHWFAQRWPQRSPWWLYALSNTGSLLALPAYPFALEWMTGSRQQTHYWSWAFGLFALLCGTVAVMVTIAARRMARLDAAQDVVPPTIPEAEVPPGVVEAATRASKGSDEMSSAAAPADPAGPPPPMQWSRILLWIGLAATASTVLLAETNQMCIDVAVVPFLWVLPLALYLISFIIAFSGVRIYFRPIWLLLLIGAEVGVISMLFKGPAADLHMQIGLHSLGVLILCTVCHAELYRARPDPRQLTAFYLCVSIGGALGGVFVGLIAPMVFPRYYELHVALLMVPLLVTIGMYLDPRSLLARVQSFWLWVPPGAAIIVLAVALVWQINKGMESATEVRRNFFGSLKVTEQETTASHDGVTRHVIVRELTHGVINHGTQYIDPELSRAATTYYGPGSGVGKALTWGLERGGERRVAVIGLGTGTLAAWADPQDYFAFYEINPIVLDLATRQFSYVPDARARGATVEIKLGDARLVMEREEPCHYDLIAVDAFSSDAIPTHLLTRECMQVYLKHLEPEGIIAIHISNRHLDLKRVVKAIGDDAGLKLALINASNDGIGTSSNTWVLASRSAVPLENEHLVEVTDPFPDNLTPVLWTDDYTNLWSVLRER